MRSPGTKRMNEEKGSGALKKPKLQETATKAEQRLANKDAQKEVSPKKKTRQLASVNNKWKPSTLITKCCFDEETGEILTEEKCIENLEKSFKSKKELDFYEILKLSTVPPVKNSPLECVVKTLALTVYKINKIEKREKRAIRSVSEVPDENEKAAHSHIFNINKAQEKDQEVSLPGGKRVQISHLITMTMAARWAGENISECIQASVLDIVEQIRLRDPYFLLYSGADGLKGLRYHRVDDLFFETMADVVHAGFGLTPSQTDFQKSVSTIKKIFKGILDRRRGNRDDVLKTALVEFHENMRRNSQFRREEYALHELRPISYIEDDNESFGAGFSDDRPGEEVPPEQLIEEEAPIEVNESYL